MPTVSTAPADLSSLLPRPKRADARRNYDRLVAAAREAFTEHGTDASLEDIARRAEVGIGTLYRNFPTRLELIEAVYVDEVEAFSRDTATLGDLPPWEAVEALLRRYLEFSTTKRVLSQALVSTDSGSTVMLHCRGAISDAAQPLLQRAQEAGLVRDDVTFVDIARMVYGLSSVPLADDAQLERLFRVLLDGLRTRGS